MKLFRVYGFLGLLRLVFDVLISRIYFGKHVKVVRRPFYIRNMGELIIGNEFTSGVGLRIDCLKKNSQLILGERVQVNDYVHIGVMEKIIIGNDVLIASKVFITDHNHGQFVNEETEFHKPVIKRKLSSKIVIIGNNVWLGEGVNILPGVTIGDNTIIGAGSIVTKNISADSLAVGNPARVIKKFDRTKSKWVNI